MKKRILLFLISIIILGCNSSKKQINTWNDRITNHDDAEKITQFEEILGKESSKTLDYLVYNFEEEYLKKEYPTMTLKDAYRQLIVDSMKDGGKYLFNNIPKKGKERFKDSRLRLEMYKVVDSVWIVDNPNRLLNTMIRYKSLKEDGIFFTSIVESSYNPGNISNDSLLSQIRRSNADINRLGKFKKAFNAVFQKNGFVKDYLKSADNSGSFNPSIFTHGIIDTNVDYDDYFIKRLILVALVY